TSLERLASRNPCTGPAPHARLASMAACPRCGLAAAEGARVCFACGSSLAGSAVADLHARKTVTVVFADVSGFTALGDRLDPEALQLVITRNFTRMRVLLELH